MVVMMVVKNDGYDVNYSNFESLWVEILTFMIRWFFIHGVFYLSFYPETAPCHFKLYIE